MQNEGPLEKVEIDKTSQQCKGICDRFNDDEAGGCRSFTHCNKLNFDGKQYDGLCFLFKKPFEGTEMTYEVYEQECYTTYRSCPGKKN